MDKVREWWEGSEALRFVIVVVTAILGATGLQLATPVGEVGPVRSEVREFVASEISELKSSCLKQAEVTEKHLEDQISILEARLLSRIPPQETRDRILNLEDKMREIDPKFKPPHFKWN